MKKNKLSNDPMIPIQYWQTKSGAHVYLVQRHEIPTVNIDILFRAGSSYDGKKQGLSHITNIMLNQGTRAHDADEIADQFADVGASFRIGSGKDSGCLGLKCLSDKKYFNKAIKLFLEILRSVNFPEHAFQRRQKQTISALQMQEQVPSYIAQEAFYKLLYKGHAYAHSVEGTRKSVMSLTRKDAENFYKHYYVLNNATIIIVGDIKRTDAETIVQKIAENIARGEEAAIPTSAHQLIQKEQSHIEFPSEQTNVWMGHMGMSIHDPDYYAMRIGNDILGGSSITSRLFTKIRGKHGLVYGIGSSFQYSAATGSFTIHFATKNSTAKKALNLIQSILDNYVSNGPQNKEFLLAKQKINNEFPLSLATNYDIHNYLIQIGFYKLPLDYINTYQARIAAVSLSEVKMALKKHIRPHEMIRVIVGP